ncbi:LacI family transcriptional regulator [Balneolaceae bacterium YR4-1]|uniref:LacI family transcriptional regulator n=1 Tax=Halalkalibaculum roseum TaxID=2709311 RepID=A0A6M1T1K0_9BACT|nr:LacI family DNA-binding transcriptional regulator [Halalkalibaculum roseum]NGP76627.1 LacI family transcriptional regulator [Halalkalibaculum roseum]
MKVTLKDIADDTGYSISTVSRVLNGLDANHQTKTKILKSARKLNYPVQNIVADVETDKMLNVLLICGIEIGEFYASFFDGLNNAASREKVRLIVSSLKDDIPKISDIRAKIEDEEIDGIIINLPRIQRTHYEQLKKALPDHFPVVSNEILNSQVFATVGFDNYGGGYLVAKHFDDKGYQTCGIIYGPSDKNVSRQRAHGFLDYITYYSDMEVVWEYEGDFSFESGIKAFKNFDQSGTKPRAIFACNDNMNHGFVQEAMIKGYQFPDDIAAVGFDDLPICKRHRPQLSSVHTNYEELGAVSIQRLKELMANPNRPSSVLSMVPTELRVRGSS